MSHVKALLDSWKPNPERIDAATYALRARTGNEGSALATAIERDYAAPTLTEQLREMLVGPGDGVTEDEYEEACTMTLQFLPHDALRRLEANIKCRLAGLDPGAPTTTDGSEAETNAQRVDAGPETL